MSTVEKQLTLNIHEVSRLRGQCKAKKRATTFTQRYAQYIQRSEAAYQVRLATEIMKHI